MTIKSDVMQQVVNGSIAEGSKVAVVKSADDVELVLNTKQLAIVGESVNLFIEGDEEIFRGDEKHIKVATSLAKLLKPEAKVEPDFAFWNLVANTFINTYMARNNLSNEESAKNAWYRNTKRMEKMFGLTKPAKGTKDSARMSEARAKEQAELQAKTDSVLHDEILAFKAEGNSKATAKATKLEAEVERRNKIANVDKVERRKAQQSLLSKAMKKINDDDLLSIIWDLVPQSVKLDIAQDK